MKILRNINVPFSRNQILAILGGILVVVVILIFIFGAVWGGVKQPISFNHKIHAENDLDCLDCHPYFNEHASSGRPSLETCMSCHEEPQGESLAEKKLLEYIKSGNEIDWQRLYRVPEDVYFSHRRHVVLGQIDCMTCHGNIGESPKPPSEPLKITMKKCMKCHEEKEASNDCIACHR
ncbi:MAG: hypothetical protein GTO16_03490 [Candidatus Aminicenantes bacterium]|nr:hypothetical protein [Candidatus Aminicenantes bacterium]